MQEVVINGRRVGVGHPVYVVAEISANHNRDINRAAAIIRAAKEAGADAVKLQTYTPDTLTIKCDKEHFTIGEGTPWDGQTLYDLYSEAYTPWEWHAELKQTANAVGLDLFSTPFDDTAVEFLEDLDVPAYKIASFEMVDLELIRRVARTGKPIIMSTGMANLREIGEAVSTAREAGAKEIILLKCTSAYPAKPEDANLRTISDMAKRFVCPVGLSDHTLGLTLPVSAVALGACLVEKHLSLTRYVPGPDAAFSMEPEEFKSMVDAVRMAEKAIGEVKYEITPCEKPNLVFRRSLFAVADIKAGEKLTRENVRCIRPGYGLAPRELPRLLGVRAVQDIQRGTPLSWNLIERDETTDNH